MRYAPRAILAGGLGFAVSLLAACGGGSGLLSSDQSNQLSGQADQIASAVTSGNCAAAANASAQLARDVQTLPITVNATLRRNLGQGASTITLLAARNCRQHIATTPFTQTHTSSTSSTQSTSSTSSTSSTTPTTTSSTSSTSSTATTPPNTGTSSTTTGGAGIPGGTTTGNGNGNSGGTGAGTGTSSTPGGGG